MKLPSYEQGKAGRTSAGGKEIQKSQSKHGPPPLGMYQKGKDPVQKGNGIKDTKGHKLSQFLSSRSKEACHVKSSLVNLKLKGKRRCPSRIKQFMPPLPTTGAPFSLRSHTTSQHWTSYQDAAHCQHVMEGLDDKSREQDSEVQPCSPQKEMFQTRSWSFL